MINCDQSKDDDCFPVPPVEIIGYDIKGFGASVNVGDLFFKAIICMNKVASNQLRDIRKNLIKLVDHMREAPVDEVPLTEQINKLLEDFNKNLEIINKFYKDDNVKLLELVKHLEDLKPGQFDEFYQSIENLSLAIDNAKYKNYDTTKEDGDVCRSCGYKTTRIVKFCSQYLLQCSYNNFVCDDQAHQFIFLIKNMRLDFHADYVCGYILYNQTIFKYLVKHGATLDSINKSVFDDAEQNKV